MAPMCLYPACRYEAVVRRPGRLLLESLLCRFHALDKHVRDYVKNSEKYKALLEDWGFASETSSDAGSEGSQYSERVN